MKTITVKYNDGGLPISDFEIDNLLANAKDNDVIHTSTHLIILACRVLHKQGRIILILFVNGRQVEVDKNGTLECYDNIVSGTDYYAQLI